MRKKIILIINLIFILMISGACGEKDDTPDFATDGLIVTLSSTPKDIEEEAFTYTINIEVYSDGTVKIYADNFSKWYGEGDPKIDELKITESEVDEIKQLIIDEDLYHLHENVGNKDDISGVEKRLTIYTVDDEYSIYGISPSNVKFNRVYDLIYGLKRDELASYILYVNDIQNKGSANDVGISILDSNDNIIFVNSDIENISTQNMDKESIDENNTENDDNSNDESVYKVVIELTDENIEKLYEITQYADNRDYITMNLYVDNAFYMILYTDAPIEDGRIFSNSDYTKDMANTVATELSDEMR